MMMTFKTVDRNHLATNSIKPVVIQQVEEDCFVLYMKEGDMNLDISLEMSFVTFEEAVKWAEAKVGIKFEMEAV